MNQIKSDLPKLAAPARRALQNAGIQTLLQLSKYTEDDIKHLHGIGPNALHALRRALAEKGLTFTQKK